MAQTEIGELQVLITAQADKFNSEIANVQSQIKALSSSVGKSTNKITAKTVAMGSIISKAFTTAISAISTQVDQAITRLDALNNFPKVMGNLGISADASESAINKLSDALQGLPTSLSDAALSVQRFASVNSNVQASTDMFLALNNAILAGGAPTEQQATALEQLTQAYSKGKPDAMEWRAMLSAMPAQMKQIATAMGYTSTAIGGDFQSALTNGEITMDDFMKTVMKLNNEGIDGFASFEEQARTATGGVQTSIKNMKIAIQRAIADIMNAIGQLNISGFFNKIAEVIGNVGTYIAAFVKIVKEAVAWLGALFGGSGSTSGIVKETASVNSNMAGVAGNTSSVASGLDSANKAAKKLKGTLASFDEMNVLSEKSDNGSDGAAGGAGGGNWAEYEWDASNITKGSDKVEKAFEKLKKIIDEVFGNLDFDKIGKSFVRFKNDVEKALKPVGKILKDLWNDYLKPFITWTGNELLPAFLNAVGGAIQFIGSILGTFWDNFLKPFVDNFLAPIAQWTGGIIVSVLNAIGESLRSIASNQVALDGIVATIVTLASVVAAAKISTAISGLSALIPSLISGITGAITTFTSAYTAGLSLSSAFGAVAASSNGLVAGIAGLGQSFMTFVEAVCSPVGIAVLAVAAAITAVVTAVEAFKTAQMVADANTKTYITSEQLAEQISRSRTHAVEGEKAAMDALSAAIMGVNTANLDLVNAEENLRSSTTNLQQSASENNMTTEEAINWYKSLDGDLSKLDDKHLALAKSVATYESAQDRLTAATQNLKEAQSEQKSQEDSLYDAQQRELRALLDEQAQVLANKGDWEGLSKMLVELADNEYDFVDSQGNTVRRSREEMAYLTSGVADDIATSYKEWDNVWKEFPFSVRESADDIVRYLTQAGNSVRVSVCEVGGNLGQGLIDGVNGKSKATWNAGYSLGQNLVSGLKAGTDSHSPSKAAKEIGGFVGQGLILGMEKEENPVKKAAQALGEVVTDNITPLSNLDISIPDFNVNKILSSNETIDFSNLAEIETKPVHVTVNVGEETLVDKIINGINDLAFLENRSVINV